MTRIFAGFVELLSLGSFVGMVWLWAAIATLPGV